MKFYILTITLFTVYFSYINSCVVICLNKQKLLQ